MIFVTGGTGLVGSHLLFNLVSKGFKVRALKRKNSNPERVKKLFSWYSAESEELFRKIEWVEGDLLDVDSLESCLEGVEIIYHCAAVVSFESRKRAEMIRNNVEGTANLVNAALARGVGRICHVSSNSALGKAPDGAMVTEETNWTSSPKPSGYSESKFFSEMEIWRGVEEGLEAVVVNPSIIVGPGNWKNSSARFFPAIYGGLRFYTCGITGFVDVRDVIDAILLLTREDIFPRSKNRKFLLNGENMEYRLFCNLIADELHVARPSIRASRWMREVAWRTDALFSLLTGKPAVITRETVLSSARKILYDGSKISRMFGFAYRPVSEAVQHTAVCFLKDMAQNQL